MEQEHNHHTHGCGCGHCNEHHHQEHHEHGGMKRTLLLIVLTTLLLIGAVVVENYCGLPTWQLLLVYLVPYLLIGHDTLKEAFEGIVRGDMFNEHFLMSVATIGALCIGFLPGAETEFPEAVFVMLFFQIGELFEGYAEGKSRDSISHLMDIRPDTASVERGGELVVVSPSDVQVGETIVIKPGEKVALDGRVVEGESSLNTIALTGESVPRDVAKDDEVVSGCVNLTGVLRVQTTKSFGESTVSKIISLVESADAHKSHSESFIARFAHVYTPIVVFAALLLANVPRCSHRIVSSIRSPYGSTVRSSSSSFRVRAHWSSACRSRSSADWVVRRAAEYSSRAATIWTHWLSSALWYSTRPARSHTASLP